VNYTVDEQALIECAETIYFDGVFECNELPFEDFLRLYKQWIKARIDLLFEEPTWELKAKPIDFEKAVQEKLVNLEQEDEYFASVRATETTACGY
jgi:hypothetical protein